MINIYDANTANFNNNGLAVLNEATECVSTKELNKLTSLDLTYPLDKRGKYLNIKGLNIIKAGGQLYRIPFQNNIQSNGMSVKVIANHIFYDLDNDLNEDTRAVNKTVTEALQIAIAINPKFSVGACDDLGLNTAYFVSESPKESICNKILPQWKGELYCDNFEVAIKSRLGKDTGRLISYGKDIDGFTQHLDWSGLATKIKPIGKDGCTIELVNGGSKYLVSPRANDYPFLITKEVKFDNITDATELKNAGLALWGVIDLPSVNYTIKFLDLAKTKEYKQFKDLLKLEIGDSVIIRHKIFNCDLTARVIKIKKNEITDTIIEIELGQFKDNIFNKFNAMDKQIAYNQSIIDETKAELKETKTTVFQNNEQIALQAQAINDVEGRVDAAELKITADAITSTVRSSQGYINDLGEKVTSEQASTIAQTASNVKIGFNGVSNNVDISETGLEINGGALTVKNANGKVVIDGSKLMFKVLTYGSGSLVIDDGGTYATISIPHGLGFSPIFKGQFRMYNSNNVVETYSDALNIIEWDTGAVRYGGRMWVTDTHLFIIVQRVAAMANSGTQTFYYRYFIEDGVDL